MTHSFWIVPWNGSCLLVKLLARWARGPKFAPGSFHYDFRDLVLSTSKFLYDIWRQSEIKLNSYSTEFNGNDAAGIFALILITPKLKLRSSLKYCWWGGRGGRPWLVPYSKSDCFISLINLGYFDAVTVEQSFYQDKLSLTVSHSSAMFEKKYWQALTTDIN